MQRLVKDIIYLLFGGKVLYFSSIQDLYNGEIVSKYASIELFHSTLKSETFYFEGLTCTTKAIVKHLRDYITTITHSEFKRNNQSPIEFWLLLLKLASCFKSLSRK